jgi:hypothetical protein
VAKPVQKCQTKAPVQVKEKADRESGAGSNGEYRDESVSKTFSHADLSDTVSVDANLPNPPWTPSRKCK